MGWLLRTQARVHVVKNLGGKAGFYFCEKSVCGWHLDHVALSAFVSSDALCHSSQFHPLSRPQKKKRSAACAGHSLSASVLVLPQQFPSQTEKWVRGSLRAEDQALICSLLSCHFQPYGRLCTSLTVPSA